MTAEIYNYTDPFASEWAEEEYVGTLSNYYEKENKPNKNMAAAAITSGAASGAASGVGEVIGSIAKQGASTIFGALGNLINEKYERRKKTLEEELIEKQLKVRNELAIQLSKANTDDEIRRAYAAAENKMKEISLNQQNKLEILERELKQRNEEIEKSYGEREINRTDLTEAVNYLKQQISHAPNQEVKVDLMKQLTALYTALGGVRGSGVYNPAWTGQEWEDKTQQTTSFLQSKNITPGSIDSYLGFKVIPPKHGEQYSLDKKIKNLFSI